MKITIDIPECECGCGKPVKIKLFKYFDKGCRYRVWLRNSIVKEARKLVAEAERKKFSKPLDSPGDSSV